MSETNENQEDNISEKTNPPQPMENEIITDSGDSSPERKPTIISDGYESVSKLNGVLSELISDVKPSTHPETRSAVDSMSTNMEYQPIHGLETVYIQQRNGSYKPAPKDTAFSNTYSPTAQESSPLESSLDIAIFVQKIWYCLSNICFGLLAGVSLLHLVIMCCIMGPSSDHDTNLRTVEIYSKTAFILPLCYYICLCFCLISLFDRFDLAHLDGHQVKETFSYKFSWIIVVLYMVIFLLHTLSAKYDDYFILYHHDDSFTLEPKSLEDKMDFWRRLEAVKCTMSLVGWWLINLVPTKDLLLLHLITLKKYDLAQSVTP